MPNEYMLDSNMFDLVVDGTISLSLLKIPSNRFYVTPIQEMELENAGGDRAEKLLDVFNELSDEENPSVFMYDTEDAGYGSGAYANNKQSEIFRKISEEHTVGASQDVNVATVAISNQITFVTADNRLQNTLERTFPELYLTQEEFISKIEGVDC